MRLSLVQMKVLKTPEENREKIERMVKRASKEGADMVVLPEICCCDYENRQFVRFAMEEKSDFLKAMSEIAVENNIILIAGSVPEKDGDNIYNTSFVFGRDGKLITKHRKVHLFDIDVEGGQYFKESDTFSPGSQVTMFNTEFGKIGLMICFDIRFADYAALMRDCSLIIVPGAFNFTTGVHWETLFRGRALDNQLFMAGCAPATSEESSYQAYGHSIAVDPWGRVLGQLGTEEGILTVDLDLTERDRVRQQLPVLLNRRTDLY